MLEWFAEGGPGVCPDITPTGTFNYVVRDREYTISEAMDVLNSMLMMKGYTLVRRDRMLLIVDLEDEVDAQLVRDLLVENTLCRTGQQTGRIRDHEDPLYARPGAARGSGETDCAAARSGGLDCRDASGQAVADYRDRRGFYLPLSCAVLESPELQRSLSAFKLQHATADEVLLVARPLLNIP